LKEANEEAEKFKEDVADLLKKAILELYREGRDVSEERVKTINEIVEKQTQEEENYFVLDEDEFVEGNVITEVSEVQKELNETELKLGIYLFAKVLNESDAESETFKNFLDKIKEQQIDFLTEMKEKVEAKENDNEIIDFLVEKLEEMFMNILIENA